MHKLKKIIVQYYSKCSGYKTLVRDDKHVYKETKKISALGHLYDVDGTLANALEDAKVLDIEAKKIVLERLIDYGGYPNHVTIINKIVED